MVVGAAAQSQVRRVGGAAVRVGHDVVEFEERPGTAAPVCPDERAAAAKRAVDQRRSLVLAAPVDADDYLRIF